MLLMGGKRLKGSSIRDCSYGSANSSSSWNQYGHLPPSLYTYPSPQQNPYYTPQHHHTPAPTSSYLYESQRPTHQPHKRLHRKYSRITDNYQTLDKAGNQEFKRMLLLGMNTRTGLKMKIVMGGQEFLLANMGFKMNLHITTMRMKWQEALKSCLREYLKISLMFLPSDNEGNPPHSLQG